MVNNKYIMFLAIILFSACTGRVKTDMEFNGEPGEIRIITLDPGHFHAALVQKIMYEQVNKKVHIYAPEGPDVIDHINRINGFNNRMENPTDWLTEVYRAENYFEKMLEEKPGNLMVTAGNNMKKTEYISKTVEAGINVLADKPMAIDKDDFELLKESFKIAEQKGVLLYDIMTERHEITTILQKELAHIPDVFGELLPGSPDNPSITKESVHHFFKYVSGNKIKRPPWFFDVKQEGDGIVDVTTHLVDLIQWECYPEQTIDYKKDIQLIDANRWATILNPSEFNAVTGIEKYPYYLNKDIVDGNLLKVFCNGDILYKIKDIHARVSVTWNFEAPEGTGDTHYSIMKGSKADLIIKQGSEENFKPVLYIKPSEHLDLKDYLKSLDKTIHKINAKYPGVQLINSNNILKIHIPEKYKVGHEAHFGQVTAKFIGYLTNRNMPNWEVPNMIAKYYITTSAFELAISKENQ